MRDALPPYRFEGEKGQHACFTSTGAALARIMMEPSDDYAAAWATSAVPRCIATNALAADERAQAGEEEERMAAQCFFTIALALREVADVITERETRAA